MYVKWIKLKNFRNYTDCNISFFSSLNLISGKNGQGKTNLVEGIMLNALTKSPRTNHDEDMKMENTTTSSAEICVSRRYGEVTLTCSIDDEKKKSFFINSNEVKKVSDVFGNLVAVYFSPDDLKIVSGSPDDRRCFMDNDISQLSGSYYNLLNRYGKVLEQRNKLLKTIHNKSIIETQIDIWNEQLASLASHIVRTRKSFIEKLSGPAINIISSLSKDLEKLEISYYGANGTTSDEIRSEILNALKINLDRDMELGYTTIGPHRDDLRFKINGKDTKVFASQGQKRSIVLALKLAELEIFEKELGEKPVLILDDIFSELDSSRQKILYEKFHGCQVIMTGTLFKFKPDETYNQIIVKNGKITSKIREKDKIN